MNTNTRDTLIYAEMHGHNVANSGRVVLTAHRIPREDVEADITDCLPTIEKYVGECYRGGRWYTLRLNAYDITDAEARFTRLGAKLLGKHTATVPAWIPLWCVKTWCALANIRTRAND